MNPPLAGPIFWRRLTVAFGATVALGVMTTAEARLWPRVATFASVARASELDALAAGDNLRAEERGFLRLAVEACQQQGRLAQLGMANAAMSEVRTFAQQLSVDSEQMADAVNTVARRKGVVLLPPTNTPNPVYTRLTEIAGRDFDREFVLAVSAVTDDLIKMFDQIVADAKDADVRELAGSQLPTLRAHANAIVTLRKELE